MEIKTLKTFMGNMPDFLIDGIIDEIDCMLHHERENGQWVKYGNNLTNWLDTGMPANKMPFSVYTMGNIKLPFLAYSTLPFVTCPGAGDCKAFCYSIKSWRYPAAFFRQLQNYFIERFKPELLSKEMDKQLRRKKLIGLDTVDFRLYVDGDFTNHSIMSAWFNILKNNPTLSVYGYSKSLELFDTYKGAFPTNYKLNLSNGSKYDQDSTLLNKIKSLPVYRGEFLAVKTSRKFRQADYKTKAYKLDVLKQLGKKAFVCPGRCATCTKSSGHACGSDSFNNVVIATGIH